MWQHAVILKDEHSRLEEERDTQGLYNQLPKTREDASVRINTNKVILLTTEKGHSMFLLQMFLPL